MIVARLAQVLNPGRAWFGALDRYLTRLREDATGRGTARLVHRQAFLACKLPRASQALAPRQFGTGRRGFFAVPLNDFRDQASDPNLQPAFGCKYRRSKPLERAGRLSRHHSRAPIRQQATT